MLEVSVHDGKPLSSGLQKAPDESGAQSPLIFPVDVTDFGVFPRESLENLRRFVGAVVDKEDLEVGASDLPHCLAHRLGQNNRIFALVKGGDDEGQQLGLFRNEIGLTFIVCTSPKSRKPPQESFSTEHVFGLDPEVPFEDD